ncbi:MAG: hypothetical protein M9938_06005 [Solirubrobacterales bacterium]|nr:hypothetical protein [Solirubrobacterales bacterium]
MTQHRIQISGGRGRIYGGAVTAVLLLLLVLSLGGSGRAGAETPQERYDRAQNKLSEIAGTVDGLKQQIAADNRAVDSLIGRLGPLRARADELQARLAAKQAELDRLAAELKAEQERLARVKARLERALDVLRTQLVSLYMSGTPSVPEMVLGSSDWSQLVAKTGYASAIQSRNDSVVSRVKDLRNEVASMVKRMKVQEAKLREARDRIAAEEKEAVAARDELEAERATYLATRDRREQRISALEERAGALEDSLPDLTNDPASSSAPRAPAPVSGQTAVLGSDGLAAAPKGAPQAVKDVIAAANAISSTPYVWGGGHGSFESSGYDCSGAVSYALHGGGLISSPLDSTGLTTWGEPGEGNWISVYGNAGHAYAVIAGLRWDTSGTGGSGPRWQTEIRSSAGFIARHPSGL